MNKLILIILISVLFKTECIAFELADGKSRASGMEGTDEYKQILNMGGYGLNAYLKKPSSSIYYVILGDTFGRLNLSSKQYLGNWPLKAPHTCTEDELDCGEPWWIGRWGEQEYLEPEITERFINYDYHLNGHFDFKLSYGDQEIGEAVGCLEHTPLRYGDIENDGQSELVLFLKDSLVVFSPEEEKVIFATLYNYSQYIQWDKMLETTNFRADPPDDTTPQYGSKIAFEKDMNGIPALRSYGKIFTKDFDENDSNDIILWRKLYRTKLQGDSTLGFDKVRDTYLHYEKVEGSYVLKEDTAQDTIQGWLDASNLTWQKGFPSKSECEGQEGELIPEMHDPLLNDPDVLK
ncbi:hypothetical protein [Bermanella sp. R86510]|uniref:hypothetical protein n=1 Tax=unclassified Bermanella TaxID=2627862 RepID=UPI0037C77D5E